MAKKKTSAKNAQAVLLQTAASAHQLALDHRIDIEARLPAGMIDGLASDLALLDALPPTPAPPAAQPAPSLAAAAARLALLVTAIHQAVHAAKPTATLRKAYGATSKATGKDVKHTLAAAQAIVAEASARPSEALGLGILPGDVTALEGAIANVTAAEGQLQKKSKAGSPSAKDKRAALARAREAIARIAGAGVLAFAENAALRGKFETLASGKG